MEKVNKMEKIEVLKMLFEIHHHQLEERRQRIHTITYRVIGLLTIISGWQITTNNPPTSFIRWLIVFGIITITMTACRLIYNHNRIYLEIASIIAKLNKAFDLFEPSIYLEGQALYPKGWEQFGNQPKFKTVWHHFSIIIIMALICICLIFGR